VTTFDVLTRMRKALWPFCSKTGIFIDDDSVDLYGPIWIMITLIVEIAIVGYINNVIDSSTYEMQFKQVTKGNQVVNASYAYYSLQKVARSSFVIFAYFLVVPLLNMLMIKYVLNIDEVNYLWLFGIYGYSYTIFLVTSALNIIPLDWLRWTLLCVSALVSLIVNLAEIRIQLKDRLNNLPKFMLLVGFMIATYGVLVLSLKKYFLA
jgi:hypothetical protein